MKFFTPDLYSRLNSQNYEEFERASTEWNVAIENYRANLEFFLPIMSKRMRELAECRLHDSEILSMGHDVSDRLTWATASAPNRAVEFFSFTLLTDYSIVCIFYILNKPIKHQRYLSGLFPEEKVEKVFWLYDEVKPEIIEFPPGSIEFRPHESTPHHFYGQFVHSVLLSNGMELDIPFTDVYIKAIPIERICREHRGNSEQSV